MQLKLVTAAIAVSLALSACQIEGLPNQGPIIEVTHPGADKPAGDDKPNNTVETETGAESDVTDGSANDTPATKPPVDDSPAAEKPVEEKPVEEKPVEEKPVVVLPSPVAFTQQNSLLVRSAANQGCVTAVSPKSVLVKACDFSDAQTWVYSQGLLFNKAHANQCLGVVSASSGATTQLLNCEVNDSQRFTVEGSMLFNQGFALDLNRSTDEAILWPEHGGENQQWQRVNAAQAKADAEQAAKEAEEQANEVNNHSVNGWTWVNVPAIGPYGSQTFEVKAATNWVNTGLFLKKGESASIQASGTWSVSDKGSYGPEGHATERSRGCSLGQLVARQGLYYKDENIHCIGRSATYTADKDGIVYIGSVVSNDLGETYEARRQASGSLTVTVTSNGQTVPTVSLQNAASYNYSAIRSGWVELRSDNIIVTLPVATAAKDSAQLPAMLQRLQDMYDVQQEFRGRAPYHNQPVRFFPDGEDAPGWMLAGNPVRMDPKLVDANYSGRISQVANPGNNGWGFAHELGHNFNFAGGAWYYTTYGGLEAWPNVLTLYTVEKLGLPPRSMENCDVRKNKYLNSGVSENGFGDPWTGLCFLMEFQEAYGWDFYKTFYQEFNRSSGHGWNFMYQRFNQAAGEDTRAIFESWKVKLN